jgi:dTDP-4-dehydrorhamnose 3,5-epimerase
MTVQKLDIDGCYVLEHKVFPDERGLFREWFKASDLLEINSDFSVQQANFSHSKMGVLRGIHYSLAPQGQAKLITCAQGKVLDVIIDLRKGSPTFLSVEYVELTSDSGKTVFIASGVGHGFVVHSDEASVVYLTSSAFAPEFEKNLSPLDPAIGINWTVPGAANLLLSPADKNAPTLAELEKSALLPLY